MKVEEITADQIFTDGGYEDFIPEKGIGLLPSFDNSGWYWEQTYGNWFVSKVFTTKEEALEAIEQDENMEWGKVPQTTGR